LLGTQALALAGVDAADADSIRRAPTRGGEVGAWALGNAALARGRFEVAHARLAPLADVLLGSGLREPGELRFLPDTVEALIGLDRIDEAHALANQIEEMARDTRRATALGVAARLRSAVEARRGNVKESMAAAAEAVSILEQGTLPFELARAQLQLGELQRRDQQKRAARDMLLEAQGSFTSMGALGWAARAASEQARVGGRSSTPGSLTPTESRVAALVSEGLANKEVASALGITTKTVELHLSHVYAKLDVGSRTELVRFMTSQAAPP
jgi:DNA-binding NarL/FixJ family response regulator